MRELRFALGYMPHRLWGNILQAQFLERESDSEFYYPTEFIQNDESTKAYQRLTPMQKEVVALIDSYSDRNLHKLFSRKATVKQFQDTVESEAIQNHIRPYIEKQMHRILSIVRENRMSVFVKDKGHRNVFPEDFVKMERSSAVPIFTFNYHEKLTYSLSLHLNDLPLDLLNEPVEIITNLPCNLIIGDRIIHVDDIDSKKLVPFLKKQEVIIPGEIEDRYFESFVKNTLRDYRVVSNGIGITESIPNKQAELVLEMGLKNQPVWILSFLYDAHVVYPDSLTNRFVTYVGQTGDPRFESFERDRAWEELHITKLNEMGLRARDQKNFHLDPALEILPGESSLFDAINFMNRYGEELIASGVQFRHRLKEPYYLGRMDIQLDSKENGDWFDLHAEVQFGEYSFAFIELKDHILAGTREFHLPNGEVAILPLEWFAQYRSIFEFGISQNGSIRIHKQHFSVVEDHMKEFHLETLERLQQLNEVDRLPEKALPGGLEADLRAYQQEGYNWMRFLQKNGFGGCLADDMGLGKTLQAIALLMHAREMDEQATSLVVVPASILHNWKKECQRFAPSLKVFPHVGIQRNKSLENFSYYHVILSTYHTVRQDIEKLASFRFSYVILDESQMIKNPASKLYQSILELQADHRMVLTGTPIENSLTDLWSQINFVNPGLLGTLNFFKKSFVVPIEKRNDEIRESKLKELINPFILRRTKDEVAKELPPVHEQIRYCNMTDGQKRIYEEEKSLARNSILENLEEVGLERSSMIVLQALTRLRQIANHPDLVEDLEGFDSGKFMEVYRDIENVVSEGHKVLLFSSFVKHLNLFRTQLDQDGYGYAYLTGSLNPSQREKAVTQFQNDPGCSLFLVSLKAGGVGLNLTAADYVFILDPWWNPAAEMQALNRAHRIGQEKNVFVYRFISNESIEEKIQRLQERKRELAATFVSSNNPLKDLSEKELMELFT